jgi:hypothetical protein
MAEGIIDKPAYVERLTQALQQKLQGAEVTSEQLRADRYRFEILWRGFDNMEHPDRQRIVWDIADALLDKQDLRKVSMILTIADDDLPKE